MSYGTHTGKHGFKRMEFGVVSRSVSEDPCMRGPRSPSTCSFLYTSIFKCACLYVFVYTHARAEWLQRQKIVPGPLRAGARGGCEPPDAVIRDQTQVFGETSMRS